MKQIKKYLICCILLILVFSLIGCQDKTNPVVTPTPTVEPTNSPIPIVTPTNPPSPSPTIEPTPTPIINPLPIITKSPTSETVEEGGSCYFVAKYENATIAVWHFVSPDGQLDMTYTGAQEEFKPVEIINGMYSTMQLKNIPYSLNGWRVYCRYSNDYGSVNTNMASITVIPAPVVTPTPIITPEPTVDLITAFQDEANQHCEAIFKAQGDAYNKWVAEHPGEAYIAENQLIEYTLDLDTRTLLMTYNITEETFNNIKANMQKEGIPDLSFRTSLIEYLNLNFADIPHAAHIIITLMDNTQTFVKIDIITNEISHMI